MLVSACGQLSRPALSRIEGAERFEGPIFHTARWDHDVDLDGKRVAVIGTGASTIQVVPAIAGRVGQLDVYQRSAPYVIPKKDRPYRPWEKRLFRLFPPARMLPRFTPVALLRGLHLGVQSVPVCSGSCGIRMFERNLEEQVSDPELRRALTPDHVLGCKRVLISPDYYSTLERPNVELVSQGVRELTEGGVVAEDGTERPADVIVLSTGFESTRFLAPMEIRGRGGLELNEAWREGANAYLGMTVAGFPNLFVMYGPNTNLGSGSIIFQLESQMAYIADAVEMLRRTGRLAVRPARGAAGVRQRDAEPALRPRSGRRAATTGTSTSTAATPTTGPASRSSTGAGPGASTRRTTRLSAQHVWRVAALLDHREQALGVLGPAGLHHQLHAGLARPRARPPRGRGRRRSGWRLPRRAG